jgi:hypothetical protein
MEREARKRISKVKHDAIQGTYAPVDQVRLHSVYYSVNAVSTKLYQRIGEHTPKNRQILQPEIALIADNAGGEKLGIQFVCQAPLLSIRRVVS